MKICFQLKLYIVELSRTDDIQTRNSHFLISDTMLNIINYSILVPFGSCKMPFRGDDK